MLGAGSCFAMNLATHLVGRGDQAFAISRSPMRGPAFTLGLENEPNFQYEQCHLVNQLDKVIWRLDQFSPDVIVNFAALCEVGESWNHALDYYRTNVLALVELCDELAKRSWFKRFVQVGSSEVYGSVAEPASESFRIAPSSPYAASKAAFDFHLAAIARHQAFPGLICMPSNGYCEGQTLNRIIPKTIICALNGTKLKLQGGGAARKSYLHADDISRAIMLVADKGKIGETYNCGPKEPISIRSLVGQVAALLGKRVDEVAEIAPERTGQDSQYWLNSDKIAALGWEKKVALNDGLDRMISWVKAHPELLTMDAEYRHRP